MQEAVCGYDQRQPTWSGLPPADPDLTAVVIVRTCGAFHGECAKGMFAANVSGLS